MDAFIADQYAAIAEKWDNSLQKHALRSVIRSKLLSSTIQIESAVCLGLGSFENSKLEALSAICREKEFIDVPIPDSWDDEISSEDDLDVGDIEMNYEFQKVRNQSLYQLIIFETVLEYLREKFELLQSHTYFQDPTFSQSDVHFLETRGYTVLPYPKKSDTKRTPCDPTMLKYITSSTFFFAPLLDIPVVIEAISTGKPSLILSGDPVGNLAYPITSHLPSDLVDGFESIVCSYDFKSIPELGYGSFGFAWPLDLNNERSLERYQKRLYKAEKAEKIRSKILRAISDRNSS